MQVHCRAPGTGALAAAHAAHRRWCSVSVFTVILLALSLSIVTWFVTWVRGHSHASGREAGWRNVQEEMLAEMDCLRDEVERARIRSAQVARDASGWADGYKQGCDDMIRAVAALSRGAVAGERGAGGQAGDK
jgi:hypothetical protein